MVCQLVEFCLQRSTILCIRCYFAVLNSGTPRIFLLLNFRDGVITCHSPGVCTKVKIWQSCILSRIAGEIPSCFVLCRETHKISSQSYICETEVGWCFALEHNMLPRSKSIFSRNKSLLNSGFPGLLNFVNYGLLF